MMTAMMIKSLTHCYLFPIYRPLKEWGKLIGDVPTATAIPDRLLSRAEEIENNRGGI